ISPAVAVAGPTGSLFLRLARPVNFFCRREPKTGTANRRGRHGGNQELWVLSLLSGPGTRYENASSAEGPMVEVPDSLVERLKERQVLLVAGLGCSELAGAPGWNELTEALAGRLVFSDARQVVARLTAAGRMTDAIAFVRDLVPPQLVEESLAQAYPATRAVPDAMTACARLPRPPGAPAALRDPRGSAP